MKTWLIEVSINGKDWYPRLDAKAYDRKSDAEFWLPDLRHQAKNNGSLMKYRVAKYVRAEK